MGIGAATLDDLWIVPQFSDVEGVHEALFHLQMGGGPVATALCVLGVLGHAVILLDGVGDDETGQGIRAGLAEAGVSLQGLRTVPEARSARAVILVRQGDGARQIHYLPSNTGELELDAEQEGMICGARLLHINGRHEKAARRAVALAKEAGVCVSFDGGAGRYRDAIRDLVLESEIRIVSLDFARCFCGQGDLEWMLERLLEAPAQVVVITDGIRGSHVAVRDGGRFHQRAFEADPLVDTTGCGDVFHGAFLHGWLKGWPAERCADFASELAARNAEGLGGRTCLAGLREGNG